MSALSRLGAALAFGALLIVSAESLLRLDLSPGVGLALAALWTLYLAGQVAFGEYGPEQKL